MTENSNIYRNYDILHICKTFYEIILINEENLMASGNMVKKVSPKSQFFYSNRYTAEKTNCENNFKIVCKFSDTTQNKISVW